MEQNYDSAKILLVDDSPDTLEILQRNLSSQKYVAYTAPGVADAIQFLNSNPVDLVVTDMKMPQASGLDLIRHVRENFKDTEIMMITGYPSIESAVQAVKLGAEDYLAKPFTDEELYAAVQKILEKLFLRKTARVRSRKEAANNYGLIGESEKMKRVYDAISKAASTSATALVYGESGTGKELVARAIHYTSARAAAPFVPINCGGIPEDLLESELFGHVKGAFTGAIESRAGFFQTADGGTIFLDEISETSAAMQVKLLRVLQDKEVFMVGSRRPEKVDVRIIAATNKDLFTLVQKNIFREDLYYRLNVINVELPPLRERENDIMLLINHFTQKFAKETGVEAIKFSDEALNVLEKYYWPGNVRELENIIQRLIVMNGGEIIDVPDLPSLMRFSALQGSGTMRTLAEVELAHIQNVLAGAGGNKSKAAEILGIDRKTLREKLNKMK